MSDYGFATKDQNGDNAINAKNPIFGFDMGHRPMAFKTFRFNDAKHTLFKPETRRHRTHNRLTRGIMPKHNRLARLLKHY